MSRRPLRGTPLLVAGAGTTALILACGGPTVDTHLVTGNLMPPPMVEFCVLVTPSDAVVHRVDLGTNELIPTPDGRGCFESWEGSTPSVEVSRAGYASQTFPVSQGTTNALAIVEDGPMIPPG